MQAAPCKVRGRTSRASANHLSYVRGGGGEPSERVGIADNGLTRIFCTVMSSSICTHVALGCSGNTATLVKRWIRQVGRQTAFFMLLEIKNRGIIEEPAEARKHRLSDKVTHVYLYVTMAMLDTPGGRHRCYTLERRA